MPPGSSAAEEDTRMLLDYQDSEAKRDVDMPPLGLDRDAGVYMAVLTACFGGIRIHRSQGEGPMLHPIVLLVLCLPLFVVQLSTILALRLDLDLESCVREPRDGDTCIDHAHWDVNPAGAELATQLKCLMVLVMQLTQFHEMMRTARVAVFVANPVTWLEVKHPTAEDWTSHSLLLSFPKAHVLFKPYLMAPLPLLALGIRFFIGYYVCVDSMSLILASTSVKDAIFNSLAMTFIVELNKIYMAAATDVIHLQFLEKVLEIDPDCWMTADSFEFTRKKELEISFPRFQSELVKRFKFLRRGHGAKDTEQILSGLIVGLIYFRQLLVLLHAYDTNVIPVARDICTTWRYDHGLARVFKKTSRFISWVLGNIVLIDASSATEHVATDVLDGKCEPSEKYYRMMNSDISNLIKKNPVIFSISLVGLVLFLIMPLIDSKVNKCFNGGAKDEAEPKFSRKRSQGPKLEEIDGEISKLKDRIAEMERTIKPLHRGSAR